MGDNLLIEYKIANPLVVQSLVKMDEPITS